jgi:RNA-directed DNA polymerase
LSAEKVAELHTIGARMDRLRPRVELIGLRGDQAVAADEAERQRIKEQKKREAAERREARQREIAERRQNEIAFLGRGVSSGLADRRCNVEKLRASGLPVLATSKDVAVALDVTLSQLRWLCYDSEASRCKHYIEFSIAKKSGGTRLLSAPMPHLERCQRHIFENILSKLSFHDAAHGFIAGRSTVSNAEPHLGARVLVNVDIKDFFPSVSVHRVRRAFEVLGYSPAAATILALLCTARPTREVRFAGQRLYVAIGERGLPQGACTSPALSNLVGHKLDARLAGLCKRLGFAYTRYADDMSCSSRADDADKMVGYLLARLRHIVSDEGFSLNQKKTRVMRGNVSQRVTGLTVNEKLALPRRHVRRLRAILHRAQYEGLAAQNHENHPNFDAWLLGNIAYLQMVDPQRGQTLRKQYLAAKNSNCSPKEPP